MFLYFLDEFLDFSTGYFFSFFLIFSSIICFISKSCFSARRKAYARISASSSCIFSRSVFSASFSPFHKKSSLSSAASIESASARSFVLWNCFQLRWSRKVIKCDKGVRSWEENSREVSWRMNEEEAKNYNNV